MSMEITFAEMQAALKGVIADGFNGKVRCVAMHLTEDWYNPTSWPFNANAPLAQYMYGPIPDNDNDIGSDYAD